MQNQNVEHVRNVSHMAAKYITPGGPDDFDPNKQDDDKKSSSNDNLTAPPTLDRQITAYYFSKYTPTQLKELVETVFTEHFDKDNNGDIDIQEFTNALKNLGLNMNKTRIQKLFKLVKSTDGTSSSSDQYIDKVNFSDFLGQKYYNKPTLQAYQEELLRIISPKFTIHTGTNPRLEAISFTESEEAAMKRQLGLMVQNELQQIEADALFQEELLKRKTRNTNRQKQKFCAEVNAEHWDKYEVAYWVGNILGFTYCMKRFFDEKIGGSMLLFDVDSNMLMNNLSVKGIHLNNFQRRLENLRKVALKDMYDTERKKKEKQLQHVQQPQQKRSLLLEFNTMNNIHIDSEMRYLAEEQKTEIQRIQLEATKQESRLTHEISELNKKIASLTSDKLVLMEKINDTKQQYEYEIGLLESEIEEVKFESGGKDKEKENLKAEIILCKKRNQVLKKRNAELEVKKVVVNVQKSENICVYELEIKQLKSKLRTADMRNTLLKSKVDKLSRNMVGDDDGDQKSSGLVMQENVRKQVVKATTPSPPPPPNQFLNVDQQKTGDQYRKFKSKKSSMDYDQDYNDENDGMVIYDSDNTLQ